jgi:hypothetical protein
MAQADSINNTTAAASRRSFITQAACAAAAGTAVQPAIAADPVMALIDAHKKALALVEAIADEQTRLSADLPTFGPANGEEFDLFVTLIEAVPTTLPGIAALLNHLDWVERKDPWKFEDNYATPLIGGLAKALSQIGVS